jgi:hypothetical protein
VEGINEAVPGLLQKYGFAVPDSGRGYLWKYSNKQITDMKVRGDFVGHVLDESLRLRFHPDMDIKQVKSRIKFFATKYPPTTSQRRKSGKISNGSQKCQSSAVDVANNTSALPDEGDSDDDEINLDGFTETTEV